MLRPPIKMRLLIACIVAVLTVMACSGSQGVRLTKSDDGRRIELSKGELLRVELESNRTTGYQWAVDGELPAALELQGEPEYQEPSGDKVGAGGTEVWTFKGASTGEGALKLKYWRSFEPTAEPAETFSVTVSVK